MSFISSSVEFSASTEGNPAAAIPGLIMAVVVIIALWRTFSKAGKPGWYSIIPILNVYTLVTIAGRPGWWTVLYFIPVANIIASIFVSIDLAKSFGKSSTFGVVAIWLFSIVGYLILGFGSAKYEGPVAQA